MCPASQLWDVQPWNGFTDPSELAHAVRCKQLLAANLQVLEIACVDPLALYLICYSSAKLAVAEALVRDGHGVRPVTEVYPGPSASVLAAAGLSSLAIAQPKARPQDLAMFAGVWVEDGIWPADSVGDEGAHNDDSAGLDDPGQSHFPASERAFHGSRRLRFVSRRGLLAEAHFGESFRVIAGSFALEEDSTTFEPKDDVREVHEEGSKAIAVRKIAVDTEPTPLHTGSFTSQLVASSEMKDIPEGTIWRRISRSDSHMAAVELLTEQAGGPGSAPPASGLRAGAWIICGDFCLQVLGPPRGEGLIGGTLCQSLEQLCSVEGEEGVASEMSTRFEASAGKVLADGRVQRDRGLGRAVEEGALLCGAQQDESGFKTASILYSTGLMTKGGSLTLESVAGSFTQIWRIRELEANPFDSPALRASRRMSSLSTGKLASPSAAVARIASAMGPKGRGKSVPGKGKGKGKSGIKGSRRSSRPSQEKLDSISLTALRTWECTSQPRSLRAEGKRQQNPRPRPRAERRSGQQQSSKTQLKSLRQKAASSRVQPNNQIARRTPNARAGSAAFPSPGPIGAWSSVRPTLPLRGASAMSRPPTARPRPAAPPLRVGGLPERKVEDRGREPRAIGGPFPDRFYDRFQSRSVTLNPAPHRDSHRSASRRRSRSPGPRARAEPMGAQKEKIRHRSRGRHRSRSRRGLNTHSNLVAMSIRLRHLIAD
ncbi:ribBA [Symbiodinium sp. CCMP2592]|nr:ribBA [Symbiodinium sp. CCMP2592]